ncbi:MAG: gluconate 2-dehydrogenase subunit 3 family protein [Acidobacteria bacterium]|nr:gluconate 2-dehydrogenase subunit 3 family protein [Acidobacteriota bacterium]
MERRELFPILGMAAFQPNAPFLPKFFTPAEAQAVVRLGDIILPGAEQAGAVRYIDLVLKYGEPGQQQAFRRGLAAVEGDAKKRFSKPFASLTREQQDQIVAAMATNEGARKDELGVFFTLAKRLVIEAYHYSAHHWKQDLGRDLNVALSEFPACTHKNHNPA